MDFYRIRERSLKNGVTEVYPDFMVTRSTDLMVRAKSFYAIWDKEKKMWSTDEYDVQRLVDKDLLEYKSKVEERTDGNVMVQTMGNFSSGVWTQFKRYLQHISDNAVELDQELTFSNDDVSKDDYVSKRLPYPLERGDISSYDEIIGTLYDPEERAKIEWAIGAIIAGDAKYIQKFVVFYGEAGAGKSTILNIIQKLFEGYYTTFEAKALTSTSNAFATEVFKENPLVAIQHDGDLSRIEDNSKLNSIVSHEEMTMNEKYKPSYTSRINSFLFMATNRPVRITDAKSGIIRRLIDVKPSGRLIPPQRYQALVNRVEFELGAIAHHCLDVYRDMGKNYYADYIPLDMMMQTDVFYNFVEANFHQFKEDDGVSLSQAYDMYKVYCDESNVEYKLARHKFREELKNYFREFHNITRVDGRQIRSYYEGFITTRFEERDLDTQEEHQLPLVLDHNKSLVSDILKDCPAQYANENETPRSKWSNVKTTLKDLNDREIHYVQPPENHIVIDFDIKNDDGEKDLQLNLREAAKWPPTYAELSKGGNGVHLHYIYEGDVETLSRVYDTDIEIKVFTGNSSLRRRVTVCNNTPVATLSHGLPTKGEKVISTNRISSERSLRRLIERNLNKEIHPGTKPSVDFIHKILEDAYESGLHYDVRDMRQKILIFASNSTNQAAAAIEKVADMKFYSDVEPEFEEFDEDKKVVFFDMEVLRNYLLIVWKYEDSDDLVVMLDPEPHEVEKLFDMKLAGFNNRGYDNHILYARYLGYTNEQLYQLSQNIIVKKDRDARFREAYGLSYADVYDISSKKQSLGKWMIELGIPYKEMDHDWDEPLPEDKLPQLIEYCKNDVLATEAVWKHIAGDVAARMILADLSGLTVNDTTAAHTSRIIFGGDRNHKDHFVYTDLSEEFPGYKYDYGVSTYRGIETGEGGLVYAQPGMYTDVALLDVESMHPTSAIALNIFGKYTKVYSELKEARLAIKHRDFDLASKMLDGKLKPYLQNTDEKLIKDLDLALKIVINIVYGLTSAKFDNPFTDIRNVDNIVAKRGALFMVDLKFAVEEKGYTVAHIKTDSIKIPGADDDIIKFVSEFGEKYGYKFEHEATYEKLALVNNSVYIAKDGDHWEAVGAQFQHPYVFKTLFTKEPLHIDDYVESRSVKTSLHINMNESNPEADNIIFLGKVGKFIPVKEGRGGGILLREKDGKYYAVSGTKNKDKIYRWLPEDIFKEKYDISDIDLDYFEMLLDKAVTNLSKFGDVEWFTKG